jgi:endonuclease/exonuclease/phosphatase family metal-dependent hydrolase
MMAAMRIPRARFRSLAAVVIAMTASSLLSSTPIPAHAAPGRATVGRAAPVELKVMTFNMEYGGTVVSFHSIVEGVLAADADVVGLEEGFGNVDRLAKAVDYPYYSERLQVISKYPLIDPAGANGLYVLVQIAPGQVVAIGNVHLPSGPYSPNLTRRGAPRSQILEIERRVRVPAVTPSVLALSELAAQDIPVFLTGDFNAPSLHDWTPETVGLRPQITYPVHWPVSAFVESSGFVDSWREVHPDPVTDPGLTWPSERPDVDDSWNPGPHAPQDRIDYVYAAGPVQTLQSELVGESGGPGVTLSVDPWGTDHRAVVSTFSVTPGVPPTFVAVGRRLVGVGDEQQVTFHGTGGADERVAVIRANGDPAAPLFEASTGGSADGTIAVPTAGWEFGTYLALLLDGDQVRSRTRFWVSLPGAKPQVLLSERVFATGESIRVWWANTPGERWDWIGVYERGADPNVASYLTWFYTHASIQGTGVLDADSEGPWPLPAGKYSVYLLADDGYRILARSWFTVRD